MAANSNGWRWKPVLVSLVVGLTTTFLPGAECNYEALYDYERGKYVDTQGTYIVEDVVRRIDLDTPIYYYGQKYSTLQVTKDGTVSFGQDVVNYKPNPRWQRGFTELTSSADKPFITPLHHNGFTSDTPHTYHGRLYWSKYERGKGEEVGADTRRFQTFLDSLGKYLSHSSVTLTTFNPHLYVMVTWENVTDHATLTAENVSCSADISHPCPSATFQLVIVADSHNTFAIFNYAKMDLPYSTTQLSGMNGGRGRGWRDVVECEGVCRKNKMYRQIPHLLPTLQGSSSDGQGHDLSGPRPSSAHVLGRFIFVVTDDIVVRGGCLPLGLKAAGYMDTVEVWPRHVTMLGGDIIRVSGQCQQPYSTLYCRFHSQEVTEGRVSAGMVGWCPVPRLTQRGQVRLEVSADRQAWRVFTHVVAFPPDHMGRLSDDVAWQPWFQVNPERLTLTWNSTRLTRDTKATVDIVLVQYGEDSDQVWWKDLVKLAEKVPNTGNFRFEPNSEDRYRCRENCDDIQLGLVEVRLTEDYLEAATDTQYIAMGPLPMAWYVSHVQTERAGEQWYQDYCERWARQDRNDRGWQTELPPCPCSLQQALADWGRWQADVGCSMFHKDSKCAFNKGAKHCVLSVQPTAQAAGSHCCYDNNNNLMYAADSYEGSTSSKSHYWGAAPFSQPGHVPSWSHWLHDLIPYYHCCRWSHKDYCYLYTQRRPTPDCRFYDPPGAAVVFGDPHVRTFDDEWYHFGGAGDFWLVRSPSLSLQARFLQRQDSAVIHTENKLLPTFMSSLAVRGGTGSDTVTFTLAPPDDLHPRRVDVVVNRQHYFFDTALVMWQDFFGLSIVNNQKYATSADDRYHSNFTVLLDSGAGVQVAERHGLLHAVVLLPPLKRDNDGYAGQPASKGLLGSWDEKKTNEFMTPDGNYVPSSEDEYIKYKDFALKWAVGERQSLFRFSHPVLSDKFPYTDPITNHLDLALSPSEGEVTSTCGTTTNHLHNPCAHDYYATGNRTLALDTRAALEAFESLRRSQKKIWSCGWLDVPLAVKDNINYTAGSTVRVTGCRQAPGGSGTLHGEPTIYTCVQNETEHLPFWDPYDVNHGLCTEEVEDASLALIIGVAAGAVVFIVIIVVVIIIIVRKRRSGKERVAKKNSAARQDAALEPGTDETLIKRKARDEGSYPMSERRTAEV
ncbi:sushi domain-containing protein 2-like [Babylonia areolata]|uniref:sushi domain-containing protein 2-like n=1 Tax=Babylonia areolata TaxID=304850 RepID=UPI003FCF7B6A